LFGASSAGIGSGVAYGGTATGAAVSTTSLASIEAASLGVTELAAASSLAGTATVATGAGLTGMATAALAAVPVVGWIAAGALALWSIFGSGHDKIPTVLNDLALFNNSLIGLPFLDLAVGSDEAAQGLRDVLYGLDNATPTMKKLAGETINLSVELLRASGDIAGAANLARNLGTRGMSEAEIKVYDYNQSLRDQIEAQRAGAAAAQAAGQAENQLAGQRYDLAGKLNVLLGRQTQKQFDRAKELAAATDGAVIAMLNEIYAIEDLTAARDASFATLERSIAKEKEIATLRLKGATDLQSALKTALSAVSPVMSNASARSQLAMFVALAKSGGVLPSADAIKPTLDVLSKVTTDEYKNAFEYYRDQARTANDIADLAGYADKQVSVEQQTLDHLDSQLETAKSQLDAMNGVNTSVLSVTDAVRAFEASMLALASAKSSAASYSFAAPSGSYGGGGGGYSGGGSASSDAAATAGMDSDIVAAYREYYGRNPDQAGHDAFLKSGLEGDKLMQAILGASVADRNGSDFAYAMNHGYNPDDPMANYLKAKKKASSASMVDDYGSFAIGSNYVDRDQIARIHQGEEITPRPYVDMQRASREESNRLMERLVASNERLEAKVANLEAATISNATHNSKTASLLDDVVNGERTINTVAA
jgi:hypothetical protein